MSVYTLSRYYGPRVRWYQPVGFNGGRRLPVDVQDETEAFVITAAVPGLKPEDLEIQILDDVVTLRAKASEADAERDDYLLRELSLGEFNRSLRLPEPVDAAKAEAEMQNGVLTLRIPKSEEARPKTIKVRAR